MAERRAQPEAEEASGGPEVEEAAPPSSDQPAVGTRLAAREIYENIRVAAEEEFKRPRMALFWSALACGLVIGFSFLGAAYLTTFVSAPWKLAAKAVGYPLGFIFVVLARNQLFTENTLEPIIPVLHAPSWAKLRHLLELWAIVLLGNLIGAAAFGWLAARTPMVEPTMRQALNELAAEVSAGGFTSVLYHAIYGGWLVALMAWLIASTRATGAQIVMIWLTTAPIAAFGFRHSVAGAVEVFYAAFVGIRTWSQAVFAFIIPAVIGNIIGGFLLVALLNYGQVATGREEGKEQY